MKKTLGTIATAILMISSFATFAAEKNSPANEVESATTINSYLEATTQGGVDQHQFLFADDFEYSNSANEDSFNKNAYIAFLKANKGINYDCKTSYTILDQSGKTCIAKATMAFDNFTRIDYITLQQDQDGWKVIKVLSTYPNQ